jgi:hypothetical protein
MEAKSKVRSLRSNVGGGRGRMDPEVSGCIKRQSRVNAVLHTKSPNSRCSSGIQDPALIIEDHRLSIVADFGVRLNERAANEYGAWVEPSPPPENDWQSSICDFPELPASGFSGAGIRGFPSLRLRGSALDFGHCGPFQRFMAALVSFITARISASVNCEVSPRVV